VSTNTTPQLAAWEQIKTTLSECVEWTRVFDRSDVETWRKYFLAQARKDEFPIKTNKEPADAAEDTYTLRVRKAARLVQSRGRVRGTSRWAAQLEQVRALKHGEVAVFVTASKKELERLQAAILNRRKNEPDFPYVLTSRREATARDFPQQGTGVLDKRVLHVRRVDVKRLTRDALIRAIRDELLSHMPDPDDPGAKAMLDEAIREAGYTA